MSAKVRFRPAALADLDAIYSWILERAGPHAAFTYVSRLQEACYGLTEFPNRGRDRSEVGPGLRSVPFERSALIIYRPQGSDVQIIRLLRRGRDLAGSVNDD